VAARHLEAEVVEDLPELRGRPSVELAVDIVGVFDGTYPMARRAFSVSSGAFDMSARMEYNCTPVSSPLRFLARAESSSLSSVPPAKARAVRPRKCLRDRVIWLRFFIKLVGFRHPANDIRGGPLYAIVDIL
jgi:hypothetical protein